MSTIKLKYAARIGRNPLEVEFEVDIGGKAPKKAVWDAMGGLFNDIPAQCGNPECGKDDLAISKRTNSGYDFYSVDCRDCGYEFRFGQQKETNELFPKDWQPPYDPSQRDR